MSRAQALIVAGGRGRRMGSDLPKQYLSFNGYPILGHTIFAFLKCDAICGIALVVPAADISYCRRHILGHFENPRSIELVPGGAVRQESVYNGLAALRGKAEFVAIHDGVRPFIHPALITRCVEGARACGACMPGIPAVDTLKEVDAAGVIEKTIDRRRIWYAQTPQAFRFDLIWEAHESARRQGIVETDDAALVERLGEPVRIISGSRLNMKITTPEDLALAPAVMKLLSAEG